MALAAGTRLGAYEILGLLGAGGMGDVYRARDARLKRDVAIKVLPESFAAHPERLARFQREAEVLASLNHPHIAAIYGLEESDGTRALVMELVEGETLADRIARGRLPLDEALPIARQIADALEAAHEQGIVHRDLKPANIKVRDDGTVKVLDFGLAKLVDPVTAGQAGPHATASPTLTSPAMVTGVGVILGTAAYMSPEQARGRPADKRSDIWAFGCVLYEMLAGKRAFEGDDISDTLAAVLRADPDWRALPQETPEAIRRLLTRCLEKNQRERLPHIGIARLDMRDALTAPAQAAPLAAPRSRGSIRIPRSLIVLFSIALAALLAFDIVARLRHPPTVEIPIYRSIISLPATADPEAGVYPALSPDGQRLAFVAPDARGRVMLWVQPLDGLEAQPLVGTEGAAAPFWSPDSRVVAFVAVGKLRKINAAGGPVVTLCDADAPLPGAWSRDDVIVFTRGRHPSRRSSCGSTEAVSEQGRWDLAATLSHDHPRRRTPDAVDDARRQLARVDEEVSTRAPSPRESSPRPADHNPVTNVWRDHAANVFELFVLDADGDVAATFARLQWKVEEVLDRARLLLPSSPA